ncbi:lytic transglycosylase domain-containing protein [Mucilaginibacter agri]|uniref:Transglycosylase SLT domain-containing protein n=1 Tax=Mucilaginibacter agri TaxID=2695265 RepID=A0A965ZGA8_9SPHI|nr:lytic transglycosylase domain-containing protein [Mucilaginibacter agri]NCD70455.1 transglycosylase SLT domain-containing protein [Mucilaginibacter agri]
MIRFYTVFALVLISKITLAAAGPGLETDSTNSTKNFPVTQFRRDTAIAVVTRANTAPAVASGGFMKTRLTSIQKEVPLDYNEFVQSYIDNYTNRRDEMGRMMGLAKYYFPIYEKAFRDAGIPEEIKFLSIVESALNPNAVSRVGATGPWQFMSTTGRTYGLNINNYVDERRDPVQASYAAAAYIKDAYQEFGDWLLAIAAYNCGTGSVERAIEKANAMDYWSIRQYLPVETRGYVPAYIAVTYLMNYSDQHHIIAQECSMPLQTDTVMIRNFVSLNNVSRVLNISLDKLAALNPSYLKLVINGTAAAPRKLIIPQQPKDKLIALNAGLSNNTLNVAPTPVIATADFSGGAVEDIPVIHTVKRGETLATIADKYGIELNDLREWNHMRGDKASPGQTIKLNPTGTQTAAMATKYAKPAIAAGL